MKSGHTGCGGVLASGFTTTTMEPRPGPELMEVGVIEAAIGDSKSGVDTLGELEFSDCDIESSRRRSEEREKERVKGTRPERKDFFVSVLSGRMEFLSLERSTYWKHEADKSMKAKY